MTGTPQEKRPKRDGVPETPERKRSEGDLFTAPRGPVRAPRHSIIKQITGGHASGRSPNPRPTRAGVGRPQLNRSGSGGRLVVDGLLAPAAEGAPHQVQLPLEPGAGVADGQVQPQRGLL